MMSSNRYACLIVEHLPLSIPRSITEERESKKRRHHRYPYSLFLIPSSYSQPTSNSVRFVPKWRIWQFLTNGSYSESPFLRESRGINSPNHPHDISSSEDAVLSGSLRRAFYFLPLHFLVYLAVHGNLFFDKLKRGDRLCAVLLCGVI